MKYIFTFKFLFNNNKKAKNTKNESNIKKTQWTGLPRYPFYILYRYIYIKF